ncbi:MAG TPA: serine/threonine protein kinase [Nannocystis exedens]|nr:serine/threonine protein kinase [Nannocystis exedens]
MGETQTPAAMGAMGAMGATVVAGSASDLVKTNLNVESAPEGVAAAASYSSDLEGTLLLDRYRIISRLGSGGMGVVYNAEHITIRKRCAIKVLSDEYANKPDIVDRFLQEARAASMIDHENVVEITDYGQTPSGSVFFVMEMLQGEDLAGTIEREGPLPWERVQPIILQICRALREAHAVGIIHRDMKPENCFRIERSGTKDFIKVLDFGIAKVTNEDGEGKGLTKTGMIFGTPEYMSPEQAQGMRVDHRADIYAVGVITYELLTGRVPFTADTFMGVLTKHMFEVPPAPSAVAPKGVRISRQVEALILKALQKDREHRFSSMDELIEAIEGISRGEQVAVVAEKIARPPSGPLLSFSSEAEHARSGSSAWIIATIGVLVLAALAAYWMVRPGDSDQAKSGDGVEDGAKVEPKQDSKPEFTPPKASAPVVAKQVPKEAAKAVHVVLSSNVDAEIIDARSKEKLGWTNTEAGIDIEPSRIPLTLVLRATGYADQEVTVQNTEEFVHEVQLEKKAKNKAKNKAKKKAKKKAKNKAKKKAKNKADTKKPEGEGHESGGSLQVRDPFAGVGL